MIFQMQKIAKSHFYFSSFFTKNIQVCLKYTYVKYVNLIKILNKIINSLFTLALLLLLLLFYFRKLQSDFQNIQIKIWAIIYHKI